MKTAWFLPFGGALALALTRTALRMRQHAKVTGKDRDWSLLLVLGWIPLLAWLLSQFVPFME